MYWKEWKIKFTIIFWIIIDFVCNFQIFLPTKNIEKKQSQKMRNVLKRIFEFLSFLCDM